MNTSKAGAADRLGRIGIWAGELRLSDPGQRADAAAELDELGYGAAWMPGGAGDDVLEAVDLLLGASKRMVIATGILNIWKMTPAQIGAWWKTVPAQHRSRVMLGLGVSHGPMIEGYQKPLATMRTYLDGLDAEGLPVENRCLAALGPKMLELAAARSAGAHPYLITPEHTAEARERLGPDAMLAPEQGVILETDPGKARDIAREALSVYTRFPNYTNNWNRLGFGDEEITPRPSDRLLDALFAWGTIDQIKARVDAHHAAGANHVCLQVIRAGDRGPVELLRPAWRELAALL